jgi:hypothetical protein
MIIILESEELSNLVKSYILSKLEGGINIIGVSVIDSENIRHNLNNCQIQIIVKEKK